jgi:hypothetical protein
MDDFLAQYVLREYARGRALQDVLNDPYVRNRSTAEERRRLLERPEVVGAIGRQTVADLQLAFPEGGGAADARLRDGGGAGPPSDEPISATRRGGEPGAHVRAPGRARSGRE